MNDQNDGILAVLGQQVANDRHEEIPLLGTNHPHRGQTQPTNNRMVVAITNLCYGGEGFRYPWTDWGHDGRIRQLHFATKDLEVFLNVLGHHVPSLCVAILAVEATSSNLGLWFQYVWMASIRYSFIQSWYWYILSVTYLLIWSDMLIIWSTQTSKFMCSRFTALIPNETSHEWAVLKLPHQNWSFFGRLTLGPWIGRLDTAHGTSGLVRLVGVPIAGPKVN